MKTIVAVPISKVVSLYRGLYGRVARKLDLDPSYVNRVARGERQSNVVETELNLEFSRILKLLQNNSNISSKKRRRRY